MQNYKTTITGAIFALLKFLETYQSNGGNLADWKLWAIPGAIAALGYVAKDAGVTGAAKILIGFLCMMSLASCATVKKWGANLSTPQAVQIEATLADIGIDAAKASGKLSEGDAVAFKNGIAIITSQGSTVSKIVPMASLIDDTAVSKGLLTPGTGLIIKTDTALIIKAATSTPAAPVATSAN